MAAFANDESAGETATSGFRANLSGAALADLVQLECMNRATGTFRITSGNAVGYLFFRQGEIVHAVTDQDVGEAAAVVMLGWRDGTFESCKLEAPEDATVTTNWQHLLLRAAQLRDEAERNKLVSFPQKRNTPRPPPSAQSVRSSSVPPAGSSSPSLVVSPVAAVPLHRSPPPAPSMRELPEPRDLVRLDPGGAMLSAEGHVDELAPAVAYMARLASLVGEQLGLGPLVSAECQANASRILLHVEPSGNIVGLRTNTESDVSNVRERFRL